VLTSCVPNTNLTSYQQTIRAAFPNHTNAASGFQWALHVEFEILDMRAHEWPSKVVF